MADSTKSIEILLKGRNDLSSATRAAEGDLGRLGHSVLNLKNLFLGIATGAVAKSIIAPAMDQESELRRLTEMLGSLDKAKTRMAELEGIHLPGIKDASIILEQMNAHALASGSGLRMLADVAAATKTPVDQLAGTFGVLYDAVQAGSDNVSLYLRSLQRSGIIHAETRNKVDALVKANAGAGEIWAAITADLERFRGGLDRWGDTAEGKTTEFRHAWEQVREDIGAGALPALGRALDDLIGTLDRLKASGAAKAWGEDIGNTIDAAHAAFARFAKFLETHSLKVNLVAGFQAATLEIGRFIEQASGLSDALARLIVKAQGPRTGSAEAAAQWAKMHGGSMAGFDEWSAGSGAIRNPRQEAADAARAAAEEETRALGEAADAVITKMQADEAREIAATIDLAAKAMDEIRQAAEKRADLVAKLAELEAESAAAATAAKIDAEIQAERTAQTRLLAERDALAADAEAHDRAAAAHAAAFQAALARYNDPNAVQAKLAAARDHQRDQERMVRRAAAAQERIDRGLPVSRKGRYAIEALAERRRAAEEQATAADRRFYAGAAGDQAVNAGYGAAEAEARGAESERARAQSKLEADRTALWSGLGMAPFLAAFSGPGASPLPAGVGAAAAAAGPNIDQALIRVLDAIERNTAATAKNIDSAGGLI